MPTRPPELTGFLTRSRSCFERASLCPQTKHSIDRVFERLDTVGDPSREAPRRLPACASLPEGLRIARSDPAVATLVDAIEDLEPELVWRTRAAGPAQSENFMDGHANAMIVGPGGLEPREDVWVGLSLLVPYVRYPDHDHPPEEVYLILSPGAFRQEEGAWFEPAVGGTFFNPPGILHAMRSGSTPLLAAWFLLPAI